MDRNKRLSEIREYKFWDMDVAFLLQEIDTLQSDHQQMYERCLKQHNDIEFWKRENSQSRARYNGLLQEVYDLRIEKEHLQELWNTAYDLGVRVEIDSVTGEICRQWLEPQTSKRKRGSK